MEDTSLILLKPAPVELLTAWLKELYGRPVQIGARQLLRHRDLSKVERLFIPDSLPETLIYKQVIPPWDIEQDLLERVLIPSISSSPQLYMVGHYQEVTALFMEDLGEVHITNALSSGLVSRLGKELARMHRSYGYRTDELLQAQVLHTLFPLDYGQLATDLAERLTSWGLLSQSQADGLINVSTQAASRLAGEPISLVHGDLFAENLLVKNNRVCLVDWSWFTHLGVPLLDIATLAMDHFKNGALSRYSQDLIESYCFESGRLPDDLLHALPAAEAAFKLFFLRYLVDRSQRGIMSTTVGHVDDFMRQVIAELLEYLAHSWQSP